MKVPLSLDQLALTDGSWESLPFRFHRFAGDRVLLTNMAGEHVFLTGAQFDDFVGNRLDDAQVLRRLRGKHFIRRKDEGLPLDLLAMKLRTRHRRLAAFTGLHIFVVTLRCEHACPYCQVSRRSSSGNARFDMSPETASRALDATFRSPSPIIKIEFQGGEPFLNFPLVEMIVADARRMNATAGKDLSFVVATNLALLDDHILQFCADNGVHVSTSLDGPADLHNHNRPRPGRDSWQRAVDGIRRVQRVLGPDRVSALMTTTEASLGRARDIIDAYLEVDLRDIFLRPLSPYGFAMRTKAHAAYDTRRWLDFYRDGLEYILDLNDRGISFTERYAALIFQKILTNEDPGYVDLTSPAGIGIGAMVYNYDGDVYASDEARMLAEMHDTTFRLGNLHENTYEELITSDVLLDALDESFAGSAPMCSDCAFEPYCGADPVFHHTTTGDFLGRKAESAFCIRNMSLFELLLDRYDRDPKARSLFDSWVRA
jgi:His-Xaa-Ser system radical SAM maturase HxsB